MKYFQATVSTTSEFSDTLSVLLMDFGSEGVSIIDDEEVRNVLKSHAWDYADESLWQQRGNVAYVSGYYPETYDFAPLIEKLNDLRGMTELHVGTLELAIECIDSADYENEWKKYYAPIELQTVAIVPEWLPYDGSRLKVRLNPGMAFGTGNHETTSLCLRMLETLPVKGMCVADVGCGSGILGATALRLGAERCLFVDIDPQAIDATKYNCELNGVSDRADIRLGSVSENERNMFSLIVANITADILISVLPASAAALQPNGMMITSGIIHSRADDVKNAYGKYFALCEERCDGEWRGMLWKKK